MNRCKIKFILIVIIFLFVSCIKKKPNEPASFLNKVSEKWNKKQLILPLSLDEIGNSLQSEIVKPYTIVAYYDGNCSACYFELNKWKKIIEQFSKEYQVGFKFILTGSNKPIIQYNLEELKFPLDMAFFDAKSEFINFYDFMNVSGYFYSSILLDRAQNILCIGNPTNSEIDKAYFMKLMESSSKT